MGQNVTRKQQTIDEMDDQPDVMAKEIDLLRSILRDASIHIRYLHERFEQTDRGYALLAKINAILVQRKQ